MTSKYDRYWAARLDEIREVLGHAAEGLPATVALEGLRDLGGRQSWYGLAEVCADQVTRSSMAHATSLAGPSPRAGSARRGLGTPSGSSSMPAETP